MKKLLVGSILILIAVFLPLLWFPKVWERKPVSCSEIEEPVLQTLISSMAGPDEVLVWLNEDYQSKVSNVIAFEGEFIDGSTGIAWKRDESRYQARFYDDSLVRAYVTWDGLQPTGKEILDCFGSPDLYYAEYRIAQEYALSLHLWYLEKGIVVHTTRFYSNKEKPIIDESIIMTDVHFLAPGSAEEMNRNIAPEGWAEYPASVLKPWPGSWEAIIINNLVPD